MKIKQHNENLVERSPIIGKEEYDAEKAQLVTLQKRIKAYEQHHQLEQVTRDACGGEPRNFATKLCDQLRGCLLPFAVSCRFTHKGNDYSRDVTSIIDYYLVAIAI